MAEDVIDLFEPVEIGGDHRELAVLSGGALQRLRQELVERRAVGQIGQQVVVGEIVDARLGLFLLGDLLVGGDPSAAGHRPAHDVERPLTELGQWLRALPAATDSRMVRLYCSGSSENEPVLDRSSRSSRRVQPGLTTPGDRPYISR